LLAGANALDQLGQLAIDDDTQSLFGLELGDNQCQL
jgi:hypothetical protein